MNIEKFYYDEQTEMYEQMKKEQDEHEQSLSIEEREKEHQKLFQEARTIMEKAERKKKEEYQITYPGTEFELVMRRKKTENIYLEVRNI